MCDEDQEPATRLAEQEDEPALTLDLTGSQPSTQDRIASAATTINVPKFERIRTELDKYDQPRAWDQVRKYVTLGLLAMLGWVVLWASFESASWPNHWAQTKEMLQTILPAITGLLGSVIGFYFGSNANSSGTPNSGKPGNVK
jgi:hypothetical protein